ncbi:autotransporter outer membrane beta-barrel domain-containing protein [Entomohabitans teleogrylli]|uniref:autotransporter outer membrane beta-barrel domain-containing protein n=1 Tax=Entomohabitans teleogrylli TaxID=1384589 RepID=UPI00073D5A47|nr:autotransporter outer membrane beta-barrel domain-containing protein [Entomohabitans teleogrylli]
MNRSYNIVWSAARNMFIVASEFARNGGGMRSKIRITSLISSFLCIAGGVQAEDRIFSVSQPGHYDISGIYTSNNLDLNGEGTPAVSAWGWGGGEIIINDSAQVTIITSGVGSKGIFMHGADTALTLDSKGWSVLTTGKNSDAVVADSGSAISMSGGSVTTKDEFSVGIYSSHANSVITLDDVTVATAGVWATGLKAAYGGTMNMVNGNVSTESVSANGALVSGTGSSINLKDVAISTTGRLSTGLAADDNALLTITAGSVVTSGESSLGVTSYNNSVVILEGTTVSTSGASADGLRTYLGGIINATDGSITTTGNLAYGIYSGDIDSAITLNNMAISTIGKDAHGLFSHGSITMNNGSIETTGRYADGVRNDSASLLTLSQVDITTRGHDALGLNTYGGDVSITGGSLNTAGNYADGVRNNSTSLVELSQVDITTRGNSSPGLYTYRGDISMAGGTLKTIGDYAYGARTYGARILIDNVDVSTSGDNAYGVSAVIGGSIGMAGGSVQTTGADAHGIDVYSADIQLNNVVVATQGEGSNGLHIEGGGSITGNNLTVTSDKSWGVALDTSWGEAAVSLTNSQVTGNSMAYYLGPQSDYNPDNVSTLLVNGGSVTTSAADGSAFYVASGAANITVDGLKTINSANLLNVNERISDSVIFRARNHSNLNGAIHAASDNVILDLDETSRWTVSGSSEIGNITSAGVINLDTAAGSLSVGQLMLADSSVLNINLDPTVSDPVVTAGSASVAGTLNITGIGNIKTPLMTAPYTFTLLNTDSAIHGDFSHFTIAGMGAKKTDFLTVDGRINPGDNTRYELATSLSWYADRDNAATRAHGTFTLSEANGSFTVNSRLEDVADTLVPTNTSDWDGKSLTKLGSGTLVLSAANTYSGTTDIKEGTLWLSDSGVIGITGSMQNINIISGATFGGSGVTNGNVFNNGNIAMSREGETAHTLTINGNYTGNSGNLYFNTQLGDDNSLTDKLKISGDTAGSSTVYIANAGGQGALTNRGIGIIEVGGESNGIFAQGNQVQIGLYEYRLYKDGGDWYLRSQATTPVDPGDGDGGDVTPVDPTDPGDGNGGDITPAVPQYRADIGAYLGNQWMARSLQMQTLYDRESSQYFSEDGSMWMRFKAGKAESKAANSNVDISSNYSSLQIGGDVISWGNGEQSLALGLMAGYINARTNSTGNRGADGSLFSAKGNVEGYNLGVYATWFADTKNHRGLYIDSWYQYGIFDNTVKNGDAGSRSYDSTASALSLEAGYRYDFVLKNGNSIGLTPQAQVTWQRYDADRVIDQNATRIDGQDSDNWTTRLGLRLDGRLHKEPASIIQPFAEVNWLHTSDDASVAFNNTSVQMALPADRAELKTGIRVNMDNRWSITGQVSGQIGSDNYSDLNGSLNVRYSW